MAMPPISMLDKNFLEKLCKPRPTTLGEAGASIRDPKADSKALGEGVGAVKHPKTVLTRTQNLMHDIGDGIEKGFKRLFQGGGGAGQTDDEWFQQQQQQQDIQRGIQSSFQ